MGPEKHDFFDFFVSEKGNISNQQEDPKDLDGHNNWGTKDLLKMSF